MKDLVLTSSQSRSIWLQAQRLDRLAPFGLGVDAAYQAIEHLGYVQIDTINVIERAHHHILWSRIPDYKISYLQDLQSKQKSVFEYWTHALSYIPSKDFRFFIPRMKKYKNNPDPWYAKVTQEEIKKVIRLIKDNGPTSIREIKDDELKDKDHAWASRKPSKRALQFLFYTGRLVISERIGMLKKYELTERHFNWDRLPKAVGQNEYLQYLLERSLRTQGLVSLDSIAHLQGGETKAAIKKYLQLQVKKNLLMPVQVSGVDHWTQEEILDLKTKPEKPCVHILSPFDPLIIQRKRLKLFFDYDHLFEAYIPIQKRKFGYFSLPVLIDQDVVALLDLKTDRQNNKLLLQSWHWQKKFKSAANRKLIEEKLQEFEKFQFRG